MSVFNWGKLIWEQLEKTFKSSSPSASASSSISPSPSPSLSSSPSSSPSSTVSSSPSSTVSSSPSSSVSSSPSGSGGGSGRGADWYLPDYYELYYMYANLFLMGIGGFESGDYWTSTEFDDANAYLMDFSFGSHWWGLKNMSAPNIRPCRNFYAAAGAYSIGGAGPAGGWVFHYETAADPDYYNYLEAGPVDLSPNYWSNVTPSLIGATAQHTAVFQGYDNCLAIINQGGHTASAALDCLEYEYAKGMSASPSSSSSSSASSSPSSSPS